MGFKSLNDEFAEYHVIKSRQLELLKDAPGHVKMDFQDCDNIISKAINQANLEMFRRVSAFEAGVEYGKNQCFKDGE